VGGGASVPMGGGVPLEKLRPKWKDATPANFAEVVKEKTTVVLHFVAADNAKPDDAIFSAGLYDRSKAKTAFMHVKQEATPEGETKTSGDAPPWAKPAEKKAAPQSKLVPASKFTQKDLWEAYGVDRKTGGGTMIVTDQFGNEFKRYSVAPKYKDLERMIDSVPDLVAEKSKKLEAEYTKAKAQHEKGGVDKALKHLFTLFKSGFAGQAPMANASTLYETILDAGREKIDHAVLHDDAKSLEGLRKIYKGSDLDAEIDAAEKEIAASIAANGGAKSANAKK